MALRISATNVVNDDRSFVLGSATPASPAVGMIRYNNTLEEFQVYDGVIWKPFINLVPSETLFSWGNNNYGQLGDETVTAKSSPVTVVGGFTDWVEVSSPDGNAVSGANQSIGLRADGTAWAWGENNRGQLGNNNTLNQSSPVSIVGGFTDWIQVSAGSFSQIIGLRADGTAWTWGYNSTGQLGDGTRTARSSPVSVVGGFTDWVQVSAGSAITGVRANGTAWAWGSNSFGQIGDGTTTNRSSPVPVQGGITDWVQVSIRGLFVVGLRANGTAWAWGENLIGQLGDGTTTSRRSPVPVQGGITDWIQVNTGYFSTIGIRANGTAWAWGYNNVGQLGDGTTTSRRSPVPVVGGFTDWVQASAGRSKSFGVRANGTAWAWGNNQNGQLGDGESTNKSSPTSIIGGFTDWVQIKTGQRHTLAIKT